jgi:anti-sigma factor RsiW
VRHAEAIRRLGEYVEGELSLGDRAGIDAHLDGCTACAEELRALRATIDLLHGLPTPEPPAGLTSAVMREIRALPVNPSRPGLGGVLARPWLAACATAALAAVAVGVWVVRPAHVPAGAPIASERPRAASPLLGASAPPETSDPDPRPAPAPDAWREALRLAASNPRGFASRLDGLDADTRQRWLEALGAHGAEAPDLVAAAVAALRGDAHPRSREIADVLESASR